MSVTGVGAPRVVVSPPNTPAPPPFSLLTQNNVVIDDRDVIGAGDEDQRGRFRWEGAGTSWLEPLSDAGPLGSWWKWFDSGGAVSADKDDLGASPSVDPSDQSATQYPVVGVLQITEGALTEWALRTAAEGTLDDQALRALAAAMPRSVENELWTAAAADDAAWTNQFRLASPATVVDGSTGTPDGFVRALARAEGVAASKGYIDRFGGAFIHVSPSLLSLITSYAKGLQYAATGRTIRTASGCYLVSGPGATGVWSPALEAAPSAFAGDDDSSGWMFVTPPVRVRLAPAVVVREVQSFGFDTNDRNLVVEQSFVIEASPHVDAIPVDYTKEI